MDALLLRGEDAARALSMSRAMLYRLVKEGKIPYVRMGGMLRFHPDDLREWVETQRRAHEAKTA